MGDARRRRAMAGRKSCGGEKVCEEYLRRAVFALDWYTLVRGEVCLKLMRVVAGGNGGREAYPNPNPKTAALLHLCLRASVKITR